jgi:uncharacterized damage-inducible protein DinB
MLPEKTREHVFTGMSATPRLLGLLSGPLAPDSPVWELSLPGRFNLRETVAHLADWDVVFLKRAEATLAGKEAPAEPESGQLAIERNYQAMDPHEAVMRFARARYDLVKFFKRLKPEDWDKSIVHPKHGPMTLEAQAVHAYGHDGYHMDAIASMMALAGLAEPGLGMPATDHII